MPGAIVIGDREPESWIPVAAKRWGVAMHKAGEWVPLFPKRFPMCGSEDEVYDRVRIRMGQDPVFKRRWLGWHVVAVKVDKSFEIA